MAEPARKRLTVDEFLAWDDGTETRYELIGGEIVAMAPPRDGHGVLVVNLGGELRNHLRPPCRARTEAGIILPHRNDSYYQADLAVGCSPPDPTTPGVPNPVVIIEVLSPSTEAHDRTVKLPNYREIPSVQEILLISCLARRAELWHRTPTNWSVEDLVGDGTLRFNSIGVEVAMGALYEGVLP